MIVVVHPEGPNPAGQRPAMPPLQGSASRHRSRRSLLVFRLAAVVGVVVSAAFLPFCLAGLAAGVSGLLHPLGNEAVPTFVASDLWMTASGACGLIGFFGFTAAAFAPWRVLRRRGRLRRSVLVALCCGVIGAFAVMLPALGASGLADRRLPLVLFCLALLAGALVRWMTAGPAADRTAGTALRVRWLVRR